MSEDINDSEDIKNNKDIEDNEDINENEGIEDNEDIEDIKENKERYGKNSDENKRTWRIQWSQGASPS